jgi:uncharacterized protein (TIGR03083 family)
MSQEGMAGMRATLGDVSGLAGALDDSEWATPSAATGWTVKDVLTHFGDLLGILAAAIGGTLDTDLGIERLNDAHVAAKSAWSSGEVVADLERQATAVLPMLESLQEEPNASIQAQLLDLGRYPLAAIPDMFAFDFYTHLRWDVLAPRGPLTGHDVAEPDEVRLKPAVGWLLGGIPKMQAGTGPGRSSRASAAGPAPRPAPGSTGRPARSRSRVRRRPRPGQGCADRA